MVPTVAAAAEAAATSIPIPRNLLEWIEQD